MSDARSSSGTSGPFAWRCNDERYDGIYGLVTERQVTVDAWRESGISFQPLYALDVAQAEITPEMLDAGAQAIVNDIWHPPQPLSSIPPADADRHRRTALMVLKAAYPVSSTTYCTPDGPANCEAWAADKRCPTCPHPSTHRGTP